MGSQERHVSTFQTPEWILALLRQQHRGQERARVVAAFDQGELLVIAPMAFVERNGVGVLQWLGEPLSAYGDVVAQDECDVRALMNRIVDHLRRDGDQIDVIYLPKTRTDAAVMPFIRDFKAVPLAEKRGPYVDLASFDSFEDYLATLSKSALKSYRRKRRRLEESGTLCFAVHKGGTRARDLGRRAIDLKVEWMETHGKISRVFADAGCLAALLDFLECEESGGFVSELNLDGHPIALEIGFISKDHYYSFLGAMDADYARYSPGHLQLLETLRWCFDTDITVFDLLPSDSAYKRAWATHFATENEWIHACTFRGMLYADLIVRGVMPLLRRLYARTPLSLRRSARSTVHKVMQI
ncbi:GNAT family N-acetyltransferase [Aquibaculum arenosum]|uniref:GNAT family N-acetyltransferase n=1 Tax=Aquibaculum arenosum TaxID=3032591 RepID=A0ABT5YMU2_9PROT|nr:GNAT family N-acetyltransferase [Fodinicurvata sp. CAU 1616]MDF2096285.1 GNAT family N-acetyltransferase [Fodinicurvata sp. CAU 1616]